MRSPRVGYPGIALLLTVTGLVALAFGKDIDMKNGPETIERARIVTTAIAVLKRLVLAQYSTCACIMVRHHLQYLKHINSH